MHIPRSHLSRRRRARSGFTVVDVIVASTVLTVGILGLIASVVAGMRLVQANRELAVAHEALRGWCERAQQTNFAEIFATYNSNPADDPGGPGTAAGANFSVAGLDPQAGDADGFVGEIIFPTVDAGDALSEAVVDAGLGMPRDLDGDGVISAGAPAGDYVVLPMRVRLRWRGSFGERSLQLDNLLIAH